MDKIAISEARNNLPRLVQKVAATRQPVTLLRYGKPAAVIMPVLPDSEINNCYSLRSVKIKMSEDFNHPMEDLWQATAVTDEEEE
ncbi:MAG: type II toxin-antitoxin system Phd/YefM family antitoxin [Lentisphaerae bacterium]|jgi:prevent-host-death family protein|nr:type II toxin-antitoxin system Phd/YefM family antitoxin [Lentisphaerota bacterium]